MIHAFPETQLLRLTQIVGQRSITAEEAEFNRANGRRHRRPRPGISPIIPVSATTWWAGVKSGRYPQPVRLGRKTVAWRASDIARLVEQVTGGQS